MRTTPLVLDLAGKVAHEHKRTFQNAHEERRAALVVLGDLLAERRDAGLQRILGHHHVA